MPKQKKFILNFNLYSISKYFKHISRGAIEKDLAKSLGSDRERSPLHRDLNWSLLPKYILEKKTERYTFSDFKLGKTDLIEGQGWLVAYNIIINLLVCWCFHFIKDASPWDAEVRNNRHKFITGLDIIKISVSRMRGDNNFPVHFVKRVRRYCSRVKTETL